MLFMQSLAKGKDFTHVLDLHLVVIREPFYGQKAIVKI
jgi:hypothetical protein